MVKLTLKEAISGYKPNAPEKIAKLDMSLNGPNNKSVSTAPKEGESVSPKLDQKSYDGAPNSAVSSYSSVQHTREIYKMADV